MQYICKKTKMSILVVGTVAFDAIETKHGKTDKIVGGAATYICHSAAPFSNNIKLVSVVGDDFPKHEILKLEKKGVDTLGLQIKKGEKTFFWSGKYHDDMNIRDTIETQLNVLEGFVPDVPKSFRKSKILMLGNLMPSVQQKVLDQMQERPDLIILDTMNFWMDNFLEDLLKSLKEVDILTINDEEARQLSGEDTLVKAAKKITKMGPKYLIIKKGEHGSMLFGEEKIEMLKHHNEGDQVEVSFNLSSKEFNGRYFHNIDAWRIENISDSSEENEILEAPEFNAPKSEEDDLPF